MDVEMAYESGIHIGDGNMYQQGYMNRITYCGNLTNEAVFYRDILGKLLRKLYDVRPLYYERKADNTALLIVNSKWLVESKKKLGFPISTKTNISIPDKIWDKEEYLANCMRGIGDTDFSFSFKRNRREICCEPRIELFTNARYLLDDVRKILKNWNFSVATEEKTRRNYIEYRLRMYGKKNLNRWKEFIGFGNPYHISKIKVWEKYGFVNPGLNYIDYLKLLRSSQRKALL